jgi:HSP20 family protein
VAALAGMAAAFLPGVNDPSARTRRRCSGETPAHGGADGRQAGRPPAPSGGSTMITNRTLSSTLDRMLTLNRALDQAFATTMGSNTARLWVPPMDVAERANAYLVTMELPGVDPAQVEVHFEQNVLTIHGTKPASFDPKDGELRIYTNERVSGTFERSVRLPDFVDSTSIEAAFENGLLTILVPKAQAAQPRRIEIRGMQPTTPQIEEATKN